jgi:arylsulfatase A-like enzyme/tetratricopeptide (TPR) repeat protein
MVSNRRRRLALATALALVAIAGGILWGIFRSTPPKSSVVLITIDTLRADRVGAYGAASPETPVLDRLAREGMLFEAAYATTPLTLPSHVSMLSGRLPPGHTVRTNDGYEVPPELPFVPEMLKVAGYESGAFVGAVVLRASTGVSRGFGHFDDDIGPAGERSGEEVVQRALAWLRQRDENPFFLWVHLYDPHLDYDPPEPFRSRYPGDPYAGEVAYADYCVGLLIAELESAGLMDEAAIIVAADHGEGLGEHGERSHGAMLYESVTHVPLIVRLPGASHPGTRIRQPVSITAIAPTILDMARVSYSGMPDSLLSHLGGSPPAPETPVVSETLYLKQLLDWSPLYSLRVGNLKLIEAPRMELYDLATDPGETVNLAESHAEQTRALLRVLHDSLEESAVSGFEPVKARQDAETAQRLAALGYISGGARTSSPVEPVGGVDIKDRIALWVRIEEGLELSNSGSRARAAEVFRGVLDEDPENLLALKFLGAKALEDGDLQKAVSFNERVLESGLHAVDVLSNLSLAYHRLGRSADALACAELAVERSPEHIPARFNKALIQWETGRGQEALAELEELLALAPAHAEALALKELVIGGRAGTAILDRAQELAQSGNLDGARREVEKALALDPSDPRVHDLSGILLAQMGDQRAARRAFERASELAPRDPEILERLAASLHQLGERQAARAKFEEVLAIDAGRRGPHLSLGILDLEENQPDRAIERLQGLTGGWPGAPLANFYLGEARRMSGDIEGARRSYQASLALAPADHPIREEAGRRLAALRRP